MTTVTTPVPVRRGRRRTKLQRRQARLAWFLLLPSLLVVLFVALYPLGKTIYQSFTNEEFLGLTPVKWVGFDNYCCGANSLYHDTVFWHSVWKTVQFTL